MLKKIFSISILILSFSWSFGQVLFIDSDASEVEFEVKNMRLFNVEGEIKGMQGTIRFDSTNLANSSFMVCVDPVTIETGIKKRDEHLKDPDFFDVEKYPRICFTSTAFRKTDEGYLVTGYLGIRDISREIEIPFTFRDNEFEGEFLINRFDYDLGKEISTFKAGEMIEVEIECKVK
jgi:polyisoprenoid-binding protein YceI